MKRTLSLLLAVLFVMAFAGTVLAETVVSADFSASMPAGIYYDDPADTEYVYNMAAQNGVADGKWVVADFYYNTDPLWTYGDWATPLATDYHTVKFDYGTTYKIKFDWWLPAGLAEGDIVAMGWRKVGAWDVTLNWTDIVTAPQTEGASGTFEMDVQMLATEDMGGKTPAEIETYFTDNDNWWQLYTKGVDAITIDNFSITTVEAEPTEVEATPTQGESPNTGDVSALAFLVPVLLASAGALVATRRR